MGGHAYFMKNAKSFSQMNVGEILPMSVKKLATLAKPSKDPLASEWKPYEFTMVPGDYYKRCVRST